MTNARRELVKTILLLILSALVIGLGCIMVFSGSTENAYNYGWADCQNVYQEHCDNLRADRSKAWSLLLAMNDSALSPEEFADMVWNYEPMDTIPVDGPYKAAGVLDEWSDDSEPLYEEIWYCDTMQPSRILKFGSFRVNSRSIDRIDTVWPSGFVDFPGGVLNFQWNAWDDSTLWRYFVCEDDTTRIYREQVHLKRR